MKLVLLLSLVACTRPGEHRAEEELAVGSSSLGDTTVEARDGLASIHDLRDGTIDLWSQTPDLTLDVTTPAGGTWNIIARNTLPDAVLSENGVVTTRTDLSSPTVAMFTVALAPGAHTLRIAPPDADRIEPFTVAAMADIQTALPIVDDVFRAIDAHPEVRFVVGMGDITQRAELSEYDMFERQLGTLNVPFYTTLGNHELWGPAQEFYRRYGRADFHFTFKGAAFTFVDSGDTGIDPLVEHWLDGWLADAKDQVHIFLTHVPPIDPFGGRYGSFRDIEDARRLLSRLVDGNVDLTLYGHIHTYIQYENAGIPAYISGGGGARPMKWDGIDRNFLVVAVDPGAGAIESVDVQRVPNR